MGLRAMRHTTAKGVDSVVPLRVTATSRGLRAHDETGSRIKQRLHEVSCVTHVPGLFCYLCPRPLTETTPKSEDDQADYTSDEAQPVQLTDADPEEQRIGVAERRKWADVAVHDAV